MLRCPCCHRSRNRSSTSYDQTPEEVKSIWRRVDAVCFDVDSTITPIEGIDEIAAYCTYYDTVCYYCITKVRCSCFEGGVGKEVAEWTKLAMGGYLPFKTCLQERLNIIRPTLNQVKTFMKKHPPVLTEGIAYVPISGSHRFLHREIFSNVVLNLIVKFN